MFPSSLSDAAPPKHGNGPPLRDMTSEFLMRRHAPLYLTEGPALGRGCASSLSRLERNHLDFENSTSRIVSASLARNAHDDRFTSPPQKECRPGNQRFS